ncbi:hypothetical protein OH687_21860 [Burkholderia anthina]|nr:hypothetical protein OH687_21860 [Burkholderia anthina]
MKCRLETAGTMAAMTSQRLHLVFYREIINPINAATKTA